MRKNKQKRGPTPKNKAPACAPAPAPETAAELLSLLGGETPRNTETEEQMCHHLGPDRDLRDPCGNIRTRMLWALLNVRDENGKWKISEPGIKLPEMERAYLKAHPEFEAKYEAELQRRFPGVQQ